MLLDIKPFCDVYYKNCYYNPLFSGLLWYNKEINLFIANETQANIKDDNKILGMSVEYNYQIGEEKLLNQNGIWFRHMKPENSEQLIECIKNSLSNEVPVMIKVDSYNYVKSMYYHSEQEMAHFLLIIGFDDLEKNFITIDTVVNTETDKISYELLATCYFYNDNIRALFEITADKIPLKNTLEQAKAKYINSLLDNKLKIEQGMNFLEYSINTVENLDRKLQEYHIMDDPSSFFLELDEIEKGKALERYKMHLLLGFVDIEERYDEIILKWRTIKNLITKYIILNDDKIKNKVSAEMSNVISLERVLYKELFMRIT